MIHDLSAVFICSFHIVVGLRPAFNGCAALTQSRFVLIDQSALFNVVLILISDSVSLNGDISALSGHCGNHTGRTPAGDFDGGPERVDKRKG